jgi:hypothetical protein
MVICFAEYRLRNTDFEFGEIVIKNVQRVKAMSSILLSSK